MRVINIYTELLPETTEAGAIPSEGKTFTIWFTETELAGLLSRYDSNSSTSPSVSDARPVLRALLDALLAE
jgi:hypothetical protein